MRLYKIVYLDKQSKRTPSWIGLSIKPSINQIRLLISILRKYAAFSKSKIELSAGLMGLLS